MRTRANTELRGRILAADTSLHVDELVPAEVLRDLPVRVRRFFSDMHIDWLDARDAWATSFRLGDAALRVGNVRGHHLAMVPRAHRLSEKQALDVLLIELAGRLLHELGHAVLDEVLESGDHKLRIKIDKRELFHELRTLTVLEPPFSTYIGPRGLAQHDKLHEIFAEQFRWLVWDPDLRNECPGWWVLCMRVLFACEELLRHDERNSHAPHARRNPGHHAPTRTRPGCQYAR